MSKVKALHCCIVWLPHLAGTADWSRSWPGKVHDCFDSTAGQAQRVVAGRVSGWKLHPSVRVPSEGCVPAQSCQLNHLQVCPLGVHMLCSSWASLPTPLDTRLSEVMPPTARCHRSARVAACIGLSPFCAISCHAMQADCDGCQGCLHAIPVCNNGGQPAPSIPARVPDSCQHQRRCHRAGCCHLRGCQCVLHGGPGFSGELSCMLTPME